MNRLWVRLSIYFSGFVLLSMLLLVVGSRLMVNDAVRQSLVPTQLRAPGGIMEILTDYYREHGSWDGVDGVMAGAQATFRPWSGGMDLGITDAKGNAIYALRSRGPGGGADGGPANGSLGPRRALVQLPINVDGTTVGFLEARPMVRLARELGEPDPIAEVSRYLLLIAFAGGLLGIFFSVAASRNLTAPLNRLAGAARAIGSGQLAERVVVAGSDEVADVALAFNEMAEKLEEAETLRRNLVADVAHELRTPLSVLQGNLRAMLDDLYPLNKEEVTLLYTQTRLLSRLVNDLHELAQAEAGKLSLNMLPLALNELLQETVEAFTPMAEDAAVQVQTNFAPALPAVMADSARLTQVFHNLLSNALRHSGDGGTVTITTAQRAEQLTITFQDTGEGIAPEHLPHLFDRFYRTDRARARDRGGAGLGLAIVRAIVQAHGGEIKATSAGLGQGSTFTVTLPLTVAAA